MRTFWNNKSYYALGGVTVVVVIVGLIFQQNIVGQLDAWSLLPRTQAVTELYFTQPKALPLVYTPNQLMTLGFTLRNNSERQIPYTYIVTQNEENDGQPTELERKTVTIPANESRKLTVKVKLLDTGERSRLTIKLDGRTEHINIWMTKAKK